MGSSSNLKEQMLPLLETIPASGRDGTQLTRLRLPDLITTRPRVLWTRLTHSQEWQTLLAAQPCPLGLLLSFQNPVWFVCALSETACSRKGWLVSAPAGVDDQCITRGCWNHVVVTMCQKLGMLSALQCWGMPALRHCALPTPVGQ